MADYKDTKMIHIESDIKKVQIKTNMYINEYGSAGEFHLAREVIQNSFDECLDQDSPGNYIEITYDKTTDILKVEDNGRSFDESDYPLDIFFTTLQSGSKFFRESGTATAGEFGVGSCVVNALSEYFKVIAFRDKENTIHTVEFKEGEKIKDTIKKNNTGKHGTIVEFKTSPKYMGDNTFMPVKDMVKWIESLFFLNSENLQKNGIKCKIFIKNGSDLEETFKFKPQPFENIIKLIMPSDLSKKDFSSLIYMKGEKEFHEDAKFLSKDGSVEMKDVLRKLHLDIAFMYCIKTDYWNNPVYDTYCNYTRTIDNGTHLDLFEECFCRFIQKSANDSMSEAAKSKYKITWDDIKTNLFAVVNLTTDAYVGFVGNSKQKIESSSLVPYLKESYNSMITEYFSNNSTELNEIIKIVKLTTKSRVEAQKLKSATQVERFNGLKAFQLANYIPCNNNKKGQFRELFIIEGNSAAGSARNACNPDSQALFLLRGVTLNPIKAKNLSEVMANKEFRALVDALGCGIGDKFDIEKLNFDRINIMTDADVDGSNITGGVLAFFFMYYRPLIEAGKLFKVFSPLYNLDDKNDPFVISKSKLIQMFQKKVVNTYKIKLPGDKDYLSKDEREKFIKDTFDYRDDLAKAAEQSGNINKYFLELVASQLVANGKVRSSSDFDKIEDIFSDQKFITKSMSIIQKEYPEIKVDERGLYRGIVEGRYCVLNVSKRFIKKISSLIPIYQMYGYELKVKVKDKEEIMRLSRFLDMTLKVMPNIIIRYKGLAELDADQLAITTMDINNRFSVQYTIDDMKRDLEYFYITHGASKSDAEKRKLMMEKFKINKEDLDN